MSQHRAICLSYSGNNELDQIQKIHTIIGTPPPELLAKLKKRSSHSSSFDFPPCEGSGLAKMLSHVHPDCADLISKLLAYNPDERLSARQALRHPYFRWDTAVGGWRLVSSSRGAQRAAKVMSPPTQPVPAHVFGLLSALVTNSGCWCCAGSDVKPTSVPRQPCSLTWSAVHTWPPCKCYCDCIAAR